jgi:hypothetical protein
LYPSLGGCLNAEQSNSNDQKCRDPLHA